MQRLCSVLCLVVLLGACQSQPTQPAQPVYSWPYPDKTEYQAPVPPDDPEAPPATAGLGADGEGGNPSELVALAPPPGLPDYPRSAEEISGAAVAALIRQAQQARAAGQTGQAQGKLERALKIEPRNYFAWSALAACYLDQQDYEQAISVAGKSNSLARGNIYVELENYRVLQQARTALGDSAGALRAQARADEIQRMLQQARPDSFTP
jgi:tetratricopeptide (TPR) repeat protein